MVHPGVSDLFYNIPALGLVILCAGREGPGFLFVADGILWLLAVFDLYCLWQEWSSVGRVRACQLVGRTEVPESLATAF